MSRHSPPFRNVARRLSTRSSFAKALGLTTVLIAAGCYEGIDDKEGDAWLTGIDSVGGTDGGDTDGASGSGGTDGSGGSGGSAGSGGSGSSDSSDPSGDSTASGGDDGGTSDGSAGDDGWGSTGGGDSAGDETGGLDSGGSSGDSGGDSGGNTSDVPDNAYCSGVVQWDAQWVQFEEDILEMVNQERAAGADCGVYGYFPPAPPLTMDPALRCAARVHSKDMADRNFFDHVNPDGEDPFDRMQFAGYTYFTAGENIAGGSGTPAGAMDQWMGSDGHCKNIMNADFEHLGAGYYPGGPYSTSWTQAFGAN